MSPNASSAGTFKIGAELEVTRLGYGAMRITGEGIWGPPKDHDAAISILKRLPELGINFIDTADSYGPRTPRTSSTRRCTRSTASTSRRRADSRDTARTSGPRSAGLSTCASAV